MGLNRRGGCTRAVRVEAIMASTSDERRTIALMQNENDKKAVSTCHSQDSLWKTWCDFHELWFGSKRTLPLTTGSIAAVACMFKQGGYRAYANYLVKAKEEHIKAGHTWDEQLELEARQSTLSV